MINVLAGTFVIAPASSIDTGVADICDSGAGAETFEAASPIRDFAFVSRPTTRALLFSDAPSAMAMASQASGPGKMRQNPPTEVSNDDDGNEFHLTEDQFIILGKLYDDAWSEAHQVYQRIPYEMRTLLPKPWGVPTPLWEFFGPRRFSPSSVWRILNELINMELVEMKCDGTNPGRPKFLYRRCFPGWRELAPDVRKVAAEREAVFDPGLVPEKG